MFKILLVLLALLVFATTAPVQAEQRGQSVSYNAAALLYTPINIKQGVSIDKMISSNLEQLGGLISNASTQGAEIFLIPESATGFLQVPPQYIKYFCEPLPKKGWIDTDCTSSKLQGDVGAMDSQHPHASFASCSAQKNKMYVVINYCSNETDNTTGQQVHYNANVVFAPSGELVAIHRKTHITGTGPYLRQPVNPNPTIFTANFKGGSVDFSIFTCYSFWFLSPQRQELFHKPKGVRNFLFNAEMQSGAPYYGVTDVASGWSLRMSYFTQDTVNVVFSDSGGSGGAGIFSAGKTLGLVSSEPNHFFTGAKRMVVSKVQAFGSSSSEVEKVENNKKNSPLSSLVSSSKKEKLAVGVSAPGKCFYAIAKLGKRLHFPIGCDKIDSVQPGTLYNLKASFQSPDGAIAVDCKATLTTQLKPQAGTWILAAMALYSLPAEDTPSSTSTASCMIIQCFNASDGCMTDSITAGWSSDMFASYVSVQAKVSGQNVTAAVTKNPNGLAVDAFPYVAVTNRKNSDSGPASWDHFQRRSVQKQAYNESSDGTEFSVAATVSSSPEMKDMRLGSAGVWTTTYFGTMKHGN